MQTDLPEEHKYFHVCVPTYLAWKHIKDRLNHYSEIVLKILKGKCWYSQGLRAPEIDFLNLVPTKNFMLLDKKKIRFLHFCEDDYRKSC